MGLVVPAVLPSSKQELEEKLELFSRIPSVSRVQIDVVDGRFASPASWPYSAPPSPAATEGHSKATQGTPYPELEAMVQKGEMLPHLDRLAYEIDLMCLDAESVIGAWLTLGASRIIFHAESVSNLSKILASARRRYGDGGLTPLVSFGLALNISSDIALIELCIGEIEFVQFMGIAQIGKQGQPFDPRVFEKIRIFHARHPDIPLQVDGGISLENAKKLVALGVSSIIIGSAIVRASDPAAVIAAFEDSQSPYGV